MPNPLVYVVGAVLGLHGLVHVLVSGVYLGLFELASFGSGTTVLRGAVAPGEVGLRVFGIIWAATAVGFAASAAAVVAEWPGWRRLLGTVTVVSLFVTGLGIDVAYAGFALNLAILAGLRRLPDGA
jgi:hypothetical protein